MRSLSLLLVFLGALVLAAPAQATDPPKTILRAALQPSEPTDPVVFGVRPGGAPWVLERGTVALRADGRLRLRVQGLVIPTAPANGTNPVPALSASVVCAGTVVASTGTVPFSPAGDAVLRTTVAGLPARCTLPTVLVHPNDVRAAYIAVAGAGAPHAAVLARGLDNPRHLVFSGKDLLVAEAGRGGDGPCLTGPEGPACIGATGAVTRIGADGGQERIAEGLASYANARGNGSAIGPHGIDVGRRGVYVTNGGPTVLRDEDGQALTREELAARNPVAGGFGRVLRIPSPGRVERVADLYAFERDVNPDREVGNPAVDSNPVDVLVDGGRLVVVDAGGNALDVVRRGRVRALAVFPNRLVPGPDGAEIPMQAVPTAVAKGPDGAFYVGQLTGFPFPAGGADVFRVDARTGETTVAGSGFTNIVDVAFDRHGNLLVLEVDADRLVLGPGTDGGLAVVDPDGATTRVPLPAGTLTEPGGLAVGADGDVYVTNRSREAGTGEVVRLSLDG